MKAPTVVAALLLSLLAAACIEDAGEPAASPTTQGGPVSTTTGEGARPTATPPAVLLTPGPDTPVCAADSTPGFLQAQSYALFEVYCPTFLPAGFAPEDVRFQLGVQPGTPAPGPGSVVAMFKRENPKASLQFVQGRPPLSVITDLRTSSRPKPAGRNVGQ